MGDDVGSAADNFTQLISCVSTRRSRILRETWPHWDGS